MSGEARSYLPLVKVPDCSTLYNKARWQQDKYFYEHVEKLLTTLWCDFDETIVRGISIGNRLFDEKKSQLANRLIMSCGNQSTLHLF